MKTLPFRYEVMDGKGEPMFIDFRRATVDDLDKVIALQNEIVEALPDKDLYATFTREESLGQLEHDICMMAECNGEVAGYSVMIPNDPDNPENYGKYFNVNYMLAKDKVKSRMSLSKKSSGTSATMPIPAAYSAYGRRSSAT